MWWCDCVVRVELGLASHDGFRLTGNEAVAWRGGEGFGLTGGKGVLLGSRIYVGQSTMVT